MGQWRAISLLELGLSSTSDEPSRDESALGDARLLDGNSTRPRSDLEVALWESVPVLTLSCWLSPFLSRHPGLQTSSCQLCGPSRPLLRLFIDLPSEHPLIRLGIVISPEKQRSSVEDPG